MHLSTRQLGNVTFLTIEGRFDVHTSEEVKGYWTRPEATPFFIIDLSETDFIDSVGLAVLVTGLKATRSVGGDLLLVNPSDAVRIILDLTAMIRVFRIYPGVEEALAAVSQE